MNDFIKPFDQLSLNDLSKVGGKNASLGEMMQSLAPLGIAIPDGYAITADVFSEFLELNQLTPAIQQTLNQLDRQSLSNLATIGSRCRQLILQAPFPEEVEKAIRQAHSELMSHGLIHSVAVRSSATAEDSPDASFAGQHDSFLNVTGADQVIEAVRKCYASLYNDRAIKYRMDHGFTDMQVRQSVGVQLMVRSDRGSAGVIFTIDPETGNKNLVYLTGSWGLGESVVQGAVNTDEFYLFKPAIEEGEQPIVYRALGNKEQMLVYAKTDGANTVWQQTPAAMRDQYILSEEDIATLGWWSLEIEKHYKMPMDIEWARDGITSKLYIVQARPETIHSHNRKTAIKEYKLLADDTPLLTGKAIGRAIVSGKVTIVHSLADASKVNAGDIIVADITNPDWNALLRKAVCIVTNKGGRTSHASIIARELGIPAVVGTLSATEKLHDGQEITVSCAMAMRGWYIQAS